MWGPWFGLTFGGLLALLLLIAIAFGTSALPFPVLIVAAIGVVIAALYVFGAVGRRGEPPPDPVSSAAPASGEPTERVASEPNPSGVR